MQCTPSYLSAINAGQHDLRSNEGSIFNVNCKNGILEVDCIGLELDTSHTNIDEFVKGARVAVELASQKKTVKKAEKTTKFFLKTPGFFWLFGLF